MLVNGLAHKFGQRSRGHAHALQIGARGRVVLGVFLLIPGGSSMEMEMGMEIKKKRKRES